MRNERLFCFIQLLSERFGRISLVHFVSSIIILIVVIAVINIILFRVHRSNASGEVGEWWFALLELARAIQLSTKTCLMSHLYFDLLSCASRVGKMKNDIMAIDLCSQQFTRLVPLHDLIPVDFSCISFSNILRFIISTEFANGHLPLWVLIKISFSDDVAGKLRIHLILEFD